MQPAHLAAQSAISLVHVDPLHPVVLNKHCRYCPNCDLLITHQNELEPLLAFTFHQRAPEVIGKDYLVLGTVDKATWRKQQKEPIPMSQLPEHLHEFKEVLKLNFRPTGWYPNDQPSVPKEAPPLKESTGWQPAPPPARNELPEFPAPTMDNPKQVETLLEK